MLINIQSPVSLSVNHLTDLKKVKAFMDDNNMKVNKSEIVRRLGIDRRTVSKYLDGFEKSSTRRRRAKDSFRCLMMWRRCLPPS